MFSCSAGLRCILVLVLASILPICSAIPVEPFGTEKTIENIEKSDCLSRVHASTIPDFRWASSNLAALSLARDCLQAYTPQADACVFYTSNSRDNAILFAAEREKKTIYDVYPAHWFNTTAYPANKWVENGVLRDVFRVTSRSYAMSCSGAATLVIPETEVPCRTSIWVTDELDVIKSRVSGITEVFRASLVEKVGGYWNWVVSKLVFDGGEQGTLNRDVEDPKIELRRRKTGWQDMVEKASAWSVESQTVLKEKVEALREYGVLAEEWAEATAGRCKS